MHHDRSLAYTKWLFCDVLYCLGSRRHGNYLSFMLEVEACVKCSKFRELGSWYE